MSNRPESFDWEDQEHSGKMKTLFAERVFIQEIWRKKGRFTKLIRLKLIQLKLIRLKWIRLKWILSISLRFVSRRYKLIWYPTTTESRISRRRIKASRRILVSGTEIRFRFRFKIRIRIKVRFPTWNRRRPATHCLKEVSLFSHRTFPTKGKTNVTVT